MKLAEINKFNGMDIHNYSNSKNLDFCYYLDGYKISPNNNRLSRHYVLTEIKTYVLLTFIDDSIYRYSLVIESGFLCVKLMHRLTRSILSTHNHIGYTLSTTDKFGSFKIRTATTIYYLFFSTVTYPRYHSGTGLSNAPVTHLYAYDDYRLYAAKGKYIYASALSDFTTWAVSGGGWELYIADAQSDITQITSFKDQIIFWTKSQMFILAGDDPDNFLLKPSFDVGMNETGYCNIGVPRDENYLYFLDYNNNVRTYDGNILGIINDSFRFKPVIGNNGLNIDVFGNLFIQNNSSDLGTTLLKYNKNSNGFTALRFADKAYPASVKYYDSVTSSYTHSFLSNYYEVTAANTTTAAIYISNYIVGSGLEFVKSIKYIEIISPKTTGIVVDYYVGELSSKDYANISASFTNIGTTTVGLNMSHTLDCNSISALKNIHGFHLAIKNADIYKIIIYGEEVNLLL